MGPNSWINVDHLVFFLHLVLQEIWGAANLGLITLSAQFADACDIARLVVPITESSDDACTQWNTSISSNLCSPRNVTGLTISAANLDIITLSAQFADACDVAQLVVQITETSDDA